MSKQKEEIVLEENEELACEMVWNPATRSWVKITTANSFGRKCAKCGCSCPCKCEDCREGCCSYNHTHGGLRT